MDRAMQENEIYRYHIPQLTREIVFTLHTDLLEVKKVIRRRNNLFLPVFTLNFDSEH